jgi:hypothetical protein
MVQSIVRGAEAWRALARLVVLLGILVSGIFCASALRAQELHSASGPAPMPLSSDDESVLPGLSLARLYFIPRDITPPPGLIVEMSLAPPEDIPNNYYDLAKYGRIAVDYTRVGMLDGANLGVAAQALHVAHHLLFYSAGVSSDINNDGMFLITAGIAHYQTGNSRAEPFVDAPFMRFRFQSSQDYVFMYSEIESTMHFRQYISGMAGLGLRVSPSIRLMGGYHHTEFVMPTEQIVQTVNGLEGIISWGL